MAYPREPYCIGQETSVLQCNRRSDKTVDVKPDLPCNVIVIHGVNDVGTSFGSVEEGVCAGLDVRLHHTEPGKQGRFVPGSYRMPSDTPRPPWRYWPITANTMAWSARNGARATTATTAARSIFTSVPKT
jgi:hypothetical protein